MAYQLLTREQRERIHFHMKKEIFSRCLQEGGPVEKTINRTSYYLGYCCENLATSEFESMRGAFVKEVSAVLGVRDLIILLPAGVLSPTLEAYERMLAAPADEVRHAAINGLIEPFLFGNTAETMMARIQSREMTETDSGWMLNVLEFFSRTLQNTPERIRDGEQTRNFEANVDAVAHCLFTVLDETMDELLKRSVGILGMLRSSTVTEYLVQGLDGFLGEIRKNEAHGDMTLVTMCRNMSDTLELVRNRRMMTAIEPLSEMLRIGGDPDNTICVNEDLIAAIGRTLTDLGVPSIVYARKTVFGNTKWTGLQPPTEELQ